MFEINESVNLSMNLRGFSQAIKKIRVARSGLVQPVRRKIQRPY
jgi:hypothetical protein